MKRMTRFIVAAFVTALAIGAIAGCSSQPASSASASAESSAASASVSAESSEASASAAAEQSQDEIIAEFKEAISKPPTLKSVTVTEEEMSWTNDDAEDADSGEAAASSEAAASEGAASNEAAASEAASSEAAVSSDAAASEAASSESAASGDPMTDEGIIKAKSVYKFDASGDKLKTSMTAELDGIKLQYISDGDDAVCVTDGPIYGGTTEQFDLTHFKGVEAFFTEAVGDLNAIVDCVATVEKTQVPDGTGYELTLDPEKYIASDETLKLLADSGSKVQEAIFSFVFDSEGRIVSSTKTLVFPDVTSVKLFELTDFDSTTVEPMPEATSTYEQMDADMKAKMDALADAVDTTDAP